MQEKKVQKFRKNSIGSDVKLLSELRRKSIHFSALAIPIGYYFVPRKEALIILGVCCFLCMLLDLFKYYDKNFRKNFFKIFGKMLRSREIKRFTGSTFILTSSLISILVFERWIALTVITFIIMGDIAGAIFGKRFGKHKTIGNKTLEGSIAFFMAAYSFGIIIRFAFGLESPWSALFMGALSATVIESLPLGIDDNLTVPVLTGVLLQLMYIGHF